MVQNIKNIFNKLVVITFFIFLSFFLIYSLDNILTGFKVKTDNNLSVGYFGTCKKVVNSNCSGDALFIPSKSSLEWDDFLTNKPSCITLESCDSISGLFKWDNITGSYDIPGQIYIDRDNFIYILYSNSSIASTKRSFRKFDSNGDLIYNFSFDSLNLRVFLVDYDKNVYFSEKRNGEWAVIKYNSNFSLIWNNSYNISTADDSLYDVGFDSNYNVILFGYNNSPDNFSNHLLKINHSGSMIWEENIGGSAGAGFISSDSNDNIYRASNRYLTDAIIEVFKYNSSGSKIYNISYNPAIAGTCNLDRISSISIDSEDNFYISGRACGPGPIDYYLAKFNGSDGSFLWEKKIDSLYDYLVQGKAYPKTSIDSSDNIYFFFEKNNLNGEFFIQKYNSSGSLLFNLSYDPDTNPGQNDYMGYIAVSKENNLLVTTGSYYIGGCGKYCEITGGYFRVYD